MLTFLCFRQGKIVVPCSGGSQRLARGLPWGGVKVVLSRGNGAFCACVGRESLTLEGASEWVSCFVVGSAISGLFTF